MDYCFYGDYHTHTGYSDAHGIKVWQNVEQAEKIGLKTIAITDHGFGGYVFTLNRKKFAAQANEIAEERKKYNITILHGVEADLLDEDGNIDLTADDIKKCDVILMGFHRFEKSKRYFKTFFFCLYNGFLAKIFPPSKKRINRNTKSYIKAIENNPIDILVHINDCTTVNHKELAEVCAKHGVYVEINMKHLKELEPIIVDLIETDCMFIVNSDAHKPECVGKFDKAVEFIKKYKIPLSRIGNLNAFPDFRSRRTK